MERNEESIEVLRYARDVVLSDETKWWKLGSPAHRSRLGETNCALTSLTRSIKQRGLDFDVESECMNALDVAAGMMVEEFNDHPDTTYADIISLFDRAIKQLEEA